VAVSALLSLVSAMLFGAPELLGREKVLTDFDAFYVAGLMANEGRAAEAYEATEMLLAQHAFTGTRSFMPWAYPPPYTLLVKGLAQLPIGYAYLLFVWTTFAFYLAVVRRIAGEYLPGVLIAILPTVVLMVRTGQNGFLTAGLIGCFLLAFQHRRAVAGVPLGLMIIKPHLAVGIALLALLGRRWTAMAIAAGIVVAAALVSTAAFGLEIWEAFRGGVREAGQFLVLGYYPLYRMISLYAGVWASGGAVWLAFAVQACGAIAGIGLLLYVWFKRFAPRFVAAAACGASLFVSPYGYDYDLPTLGVGIAFVLPDIIRRARRWQLLVLLALSWIATGYGLALNSVLEVWPNSEVDDVVTDLGKDFFPSLGGPALLLLMIGACAILRREGPSESGRVGGPTDARLAGDAPASLSSASSISPPTGGNAQLENA
jgi:hypothetical protein